MTGSNGGLKLARTIRRNAAKMGGWTLECANAPELGLQSVAEHTLHDAQAGAAAVLLVTTQLPSEPRQDMSDDELRPLIAAAYADSPWIDQQRILLELRDPAVPFDESARLYLNLPSAATTALVSPARWAELARPEPAIAEGARVGVGFDGSTAQDATALVICSEDGHLQLVGLWERPANAATWQVPRSEVQRAVDEVFSRYSVALLLADPWQWREELDAWAERYGDKIVLDFPTNSIRRFGPAVDRFRAALATGTVSHDGDARLARHLANARLVRSRGAADDERQPYTLAKAGPGRFMDAAVAAVLAFEATATAEPAPVEFVPMVACR